MSDHQTDPIIRTKLYRPPVAGDYISRERLLKRLEAGFRFPLTLVSAPAGYGKSSLISHWVEGCPHRSVWLSLDEIHSNLRTFLQYLVAALQNLSPSSCQEIQALLQAEVLPLPSSLAGTLSNELDLLGERLILVLDDYYNVTAPEIHEFMDCVLQIRIHCLHLVILSRRDPPFSLATMRGKHLMTDIRLQDLQFTGEETAAFLEEILGRPVAPESLTQLMAKTEGWPVALRLIAIAVQNRTDLGAFFRSFAGDSRHLHEYLVSEILLRQSEESRDCLCRTSILDRFCASLCRELCDFQCGSQNCVFHDDRADQPFQNVGLLCIPLDEKGEWFRFHHLFQELLKQHLEQNVAPESISELHRRSAVWFEERGWLEEALQHFLKAGDPEEAGRLIGQHRSEILNGEQWNRLEQWISWLPSEIVNGSPELLVLTAWLMQNRCRYADCFDLIDRAAKLLEVTRSDSPLVQHLKGSVNILRSYQRYSEGNAALAIDCASRALEQVPDDCHVERGNAVIYMAISHQMVGKWQRAHELVNKELVSDPLQGKHTTYHSRLLGALCFVDWMEADLWLLERSATQMVERGDEVGLPETSAVGRYFIGTARYHLNALAEAESYLASVVSRSSAANLEFSAQSVFALASVYQAKGEWNKATEMVDSFCDQMLRSRNTAVLALAQAFQADLALRQGRLTRALKWAQNFNPEPFGQMYRFHVPQVTLAMILVSQRKSEKSFQKASDFLKQLEDYVVRTHNQRFLIEVKALQAILLNSRGQKAEALANLREAVLVAQPSGFLRLFVDLGPEIVGLLEDFDADGEQARYIGRILEAFRESETGRLAERKPGIGARPTEQNLIEPLTNRELDILNLLDNRLTNKEIAEQLHISPATVKRHAENLYGKLGVSSRREAVDRAKHLRILVP